MSESYTTQLARVQAAIAAIESGAARVRFEGREVEYADLKTLYQREERLRGQAARESRGGGLTVSLGAG